MNFSLHEFEGRGPCPPKYHGNIHRLMAALEVVRAEFGGAAITITPAGGYRSPEVNRQNKGRASRSQHMVGKAADIQVAGYSPSQVYYMIAQLQEQGRIPKGGLAAYPTFVHYDIRGRNARWRKAP